MILRIGTRGSALARAQASDVARRLESAGHSTELVIITTLGDQASDRAFTDVGAFGIFVREIEAALMAGHVDLAVHSYKDLPSQGPEELVIAAVPERLDAADVLLVREDVLESSGGALPLRAGARVGTSAARRTAWLRALQPDLVIDLLRGNVPTRVRALVDGRFDAIVLAAAGLARLERATGDDRLTLPTGIARVRLDPERFVPAPSQGAIALQVRRAATAVHLAVAGINDPSTASALQAERAALRLAEGGCTLPFGAWCREDPDSGLTLLAALGCDDGTMVRAQAGNGEPDALAASVWADLARASGRHNHIGAAAPTSGGDLVPSAGATPA
jgi:hydroxymethylbilane synthase